MDSTESSRAAGLAEQRVHLDQQLRVRIVHQLDGLGRALGHARAAAWHATGSMKAAPTMPPTPLRSALILGTSKGQVRTQVRQPTHLSAFTTATRALDVRVSCARIEAARAQRLAPG